jgi:hypothetical protein
LAWSHCSTHGVKCGATHAAPQSILRVSNALPAEAGTWFGIRGGGRAPPSTCVSRTTRVCHACRVSHGLCDAQSVQIVACVTVCALYLHSHACTRLQLAPMPGGPRASQSSGGILRATRQCAGGRPRVRAPDGAHPLATSADGTGWGWRGQSPCSRGGPRVH